MADADLKIKIGADVQDVTKSLDKLEQEFNDLKKAVKNVSNQSDLTGLNKELAKTASNIKSIKNASAAGFGDAAGQLQGLSKGGGQATLALTNLNRVIQDAPFGIIGIANNIDPLITSFQQLGKATGGPAAALKAFAGTLLGPAGILFAFSALSSAATVAIQKYGSLGAAFDALTGKVKPLTEEQKEFAKAQRETALSIERQRIEVNSLVAIARGDIGTKKEQALALQQLNKLIPDNIGVLTKQNIVTKEGIAIIQSYTQALVRQAEAELLIKQAAELRVKLAERERTLYQDIRKEQQQGANAYQQLAAQASGVSGALSGIAVVNQQLSDTQKITVENTKAFKDYIGQYKELASLTARIEKLTAGTLIIEADDPKKDAIKVKEQLEREFQFSPVRLPISTFILPSGIEIKQSDRASFVDQLGLTNIDTTKALGAFKELKAGIVALKPLQPVTDALFSLQQLLDTVANGLTNTFANVFTGLLEGVSVVESLARSFKQLLGQIVATILKALVLKGIFAALTGGANQAANFITGGGFLGFNAAPSGINGGAASLFGRAGSGGQVEFVIQGQNLVGVLNRANNFRTING